MCETCGCGDTHLVSVDVHTSLLAGNDRMAEHNRAHFREAGLVVLNVMGSPGSGKTAVLEATSRRASGLRLSALSGDLATDRDADRLNAAGIAARSITTGSACHLDAHMVHESLHGWPAGTDADVLFIENVGNLVCPAIYDLGQDANVVVLSVTEGPDKPLKYPVMFRTADLVLLTKVDLLPHLYVDVDEIRDGLRRTMPSPAMIQMSTVDGTGVDEWMAWLAARLPALSPDGRGVRR